MSWNPTSKAFILADLMKQISEMDDDELYQTYGLVIYEDETVYDETEDKEFDSVAIWADWTAEQQVQDERAERYGTYEE